MTKIAQHTSRVNIVLDGVHMPWLEGGGLHTPPSIFDAHKHMHITMWIDEWAVACRSHSACVRTLICSFLS